MRTAEWVNQWFQTASLDWQPDWRETVRRWHLPAITGPLGDYALADLTPEKCALWWTALRSAKSPGMANKILTTFRACLAQAVQWGYLPSNPAAPLKPAKAPRGRVKYFLPDQRSRLLQAANARLSPYLHVALYTGARRASLLELRWKDVDLAGGTITFQHMKAGGTHTIPLHPELARYLASYRRPDAGQDDYVLPRYRPRALSQAFTRLARRVGEQDARFHDLRHDFASRLAQKGAGVLVIKEALGHRDVRSTLRYAHLDRGAVQRALTLL